MSFLGVMFAPTGFHQFWWKFDENAFPPHTIDEKNWVFFDEKKTHTQALLNFVSFVKL